MHQLQDAMPGSNRKRDGEVRDNDGKQLTSVSKKAKCRYDKSKPVCTLTEEQRERLELHVNRRFKVVKFLLFPDDLGECLTAMEDTGELDMAFKAIGAGGRTREDELERARCWNITAETYCAMLSKIQKEIISRWTDHVKGEAFCKI